MPETRGSSDSVTAADVEYSVRLAVATLRGAEAPDWDAKAGALEWDCWETVEHLADDLFSYAAQLGPESPPLDTHIPFVWSRKSRAARRTSSSRTVTPVRPACCRYWKPAAPC